MLHSRYVYGNLAFWDTHQNRIVDAIGPGVRKYINHFTDNVTSATDTPTGWTVTLTEAGGGETTLAS